MAPEHPLEPHVPVHPLSLWPGARSSRTICSGGSATTFKNPALPDPALTHVPGRSKGEQLSAARIPRRPRARSHDRRDALRRRRLRKANSRRCPSSSAARPAPRWRSPGISDPTSTSARARCNPGRRSNQALPTSARPSSARCSLTAAIGRESARRAGLRHPAVGAAAVAARPQERTSGMGSRPGLARAKLHRRGARRSGSRAAVPGDRPGQGDRERARGRNLEAGGGTGSGA